MRDDLGEHAGEPGLDELVAGDGAAELDALLGVAEGDFVSGDGVAEGLPGGAAAVAVSTRVASRNDSAPASLLSAGTRTSRRSTSGCQTARLPILPVISSVV